MYANFKTIDQEVRESQDRVQTVTKDSNCITNVYQNLSSSKHTSTQILVSKPFSNYRNQSFGEIAGLMANTGNIQDESGVPYSIKKIRKRRKDGDISKEQRNQTERAPNG